MEHQLIKPKRLYEQVIEQMENQYKLGHLKIGDMLPSERELTKELGVSRGTLRDAFRILESQGVIETRPGGGRFLRSDFTKSPNPDQSIVDELRKAARLDLVEAREIFELGMIELVCTRATDQDIQRLEEIALMSKEESFNDETYTPFNIALAECSKNTAIINFMKLHLEILNETKELSFRENENFQNAQIEHLEIVQAVKTRDVQLTKEKMVKHLQQVRKRSMNQTN